MKHGRKNRQDSKSPRDKNGWKHASFLDKGFVHTPHQKKLARINRKEKSAPLGEL